MTHIKLIEKYLSDINIKYLYYKSSVNDIINLMDIENIISNFSKKDIKRIYFLSVEMLQNISRYQDNYSDNEFIFSIIRDEDTDNIFLVAGNYIENNKCTSYISKIDNINNLDCESLKNLYKDKLENSGYNEKGGAGLGLIEMSKKTNHKLEYHVRKINKDYSFVYNILKYTLNSEIYDKKVQHEHKKEGVLI